MKFLGNSSPESGSVPLTPLIDIIFLLIIFFLVSSTFQSQEKELGVQLPQTKGGASKTSASKNWTLSIQSDGALYFKNNPVSMNELEGLLDISKGERDQVSIILRADHRVPYGVVGKVLGLLDEYEYKKLSLPVLDLPENEKP